MDSSVALVGLLLLGCLLVTCCALPSQFDSKLFERAELETLSSVRALADARCSLTQTHGQDQLQAPSVPASCEPVHRWIRHNATDIDLLRFIRASHAAALPDPAAHLISLLTKHVAWRASPLGADTITSPEADTPERRRIYSLLSQEVFWLGLSRSGCPTLVIRTQLHDGVSVERGESGEEG